MIVVEDPKKTALLLRESGITVPADITFGELAKIYAKQSQVNPKFKKLLNSEGYDNVIGATAVIGGLSTALGGLFGIGEASKEAKASEAESEAQILQAAINAKIESDKRKAAKKRNELLLIGILAFVMLSIIGFIIYLKAK